MLQIAYIRAHKEEVTKRIGKKGFSNADLLDTILALDDQRKKLQFEKDEKQGAVNILSREIKTFMSSGRKEEGEAKRAEVLETKNDIQKLSDSLSSVEKQLYELLVTIPNMAHESVPEGTSAEDNEIVRQGGALPKWTHKVMPHWELARKYDLINFELG